ncbi:hypothetical protein BGZ47_004519 [Haplosporangium gracile]|nr:hypothetical protein BGZ47_004519 [Haplosporangium gracile]
MKFTTSLVVAAAGLLSMVAAQTGTFTNITSDPHYPNAQLSVISASISPFPMCIGKQFCLTLTGTLSKPILQGAKYSIGGRLFGTPAYSDYGADLCSLLAANGTPCPVAAGPATLTVCRDIKSNLPANLRVLSWEYSAINPDGTRIFNQLVDPRAGLFGVKCPA